jgi:AAA15 family ATPase/GTPase
MFSISRINMTSSPIGESVIDFRKINIIVGPNNSGKSTLLKDIERWFNSQESQMKLLKNVHISFNDHSEYDKFEKDILEFQDGEPKQEGGKELIPFTKKHLFEDGHDSPQ